MSSQPESHEFQAEIRQLLDIVVHSLYTEREIFLRELISNASDAMEKWRHTLAIEKDAPDCGLPLEVRILTDKEKRTLTIEDHGIGMTRDNLAEHLGTIAHSGTRRFLEAAKSAGKSPENVIGRFGVGFYSAFMVAAKVEVFTRSWQTDAEGLLWSSDGATGYRIEPSEEAPQRGTRIVLHLKEDAAEFLEAARIESLVKTYSNYVGFPILLDGKRLNEVEALWLKPKSEISEDEYKAFYQFAAKAWDEPFYHLHFSADAPIDLNALIFVPSRNPEAPGFGRIDPGVALHCRKILIDNHPPHLLPEWMRFLKGVIDSQDLPLNISRETMQDSALVRKIGDVIAKRVIRMLESAAKADADKYQTFHREFGIFLREGILTDPTRAASLAPLLRFESSLSGKDDIPAQTSLDDYLTRAREGQEQIFHLSGRSRSEIEASPCLEAFTSRGIEVLFLTGEIDEMVMDSLGEYQGKKLTSAARAGLDLGDPSEPATETDQPPLDETQTESLIAFLTKTLDGKVERVAVGTRLTQSPAAALLPEQAMTPAMRRMMRAMNPEFKDDTKVELEINPRHPLIHKLAGAVPSNSETAAIVAEQLFENALSAAGMERRETPQDSVSRINALMEKALD